MRGGVIFVARDMDFRALDNSATLKFVKGASPKSPQRMQLFDSHPGVPQFLMMDAKRSTPAIPYHTRPYHSCGAAPTPGIGLWGLINPLV